MNSNDSNPSQMRSSGAEARTAALLHWAGYALLVMAALDLVESLIPPGFMNPGWELQVMGDSIERSPVILLGFMLVFHAEWTRRAWWEHWVLPAISWATLVAGLAFLLAIPLLVLDTFRVDAGGERQINAQLDQQISQAKQLQGAITAAHGVDLETLLRRAGRTVGSADLESSRAQILAELTTAEQDLHRRAVEVRARQKLDLHKRNYKHVAQAVVVGMVLIVYWFGTGWARKSRRKT